MNPNVNPSQDYKQTLGKVDKDEKLLAVIKRHPFGIVKLYAQVIIGFFVLSGLASYILPNIVSREDNPGIYSFLALAAVALLIFLALVLFIATVLYYQSKLVVTDKTITQTLQVGLFDRKVSQLAVSNIEDVTSDKRGFFATLLNFGKLYVETAGEQENFHFEYCPNADHYAKLILETRQAYLESGQVQEIGLHALPNYLGMANRANQMNQMNQMNQPYSQPMAMTPEQYAQAYAQQYPQPVPPPQPPQPVQPPQSPSGFESPATPETDYRGPA